MRSKYRISCSQILTIILFVCTLSVKAQTGNGKFNKALADSLGADEYGMKMYVLVILKSGANKMDDKAKKDSVFAGHLKNIKRLAAMGKLVVAGPLADNPKGYRGIFIYNVKTLAEASSLLKTDPAIKAKLLDSELYQWYGSAALPAYLPVSEKVAEKSF